MKYSMLLIYLCHVLFEYSKLTGTICASFFKLVSIWYRTFDTEYSTVTITLQWRHNDHDGVSNHQPHGCLLNRLFRHRSKKTSKLRVTGLCMGNSPGPVNSPHKGPVTRKMFPFDDVIMKTKRSANNPDTVTGICQTCKHISTIRVH